MHAPRQDQISEAPDCFSLQARVRTRSATPGCFGAEETGKSNSSPQSKQTL
jgi:hypothetical protein